MRAVQAEKLAARGHEPVLAPLLAIEIVAGVALELDGRASPDRHQPQCACARSPRIASLTRPASFRSLPSARRPPVRRTSLALPTSRQGPERAQAIAKLIVGRARAGRRPARASCRRDAGLRPEIGASKRKASPCASPCSIGPSRRRELPPEALRLLKAGRLDGAILMSPRTARDFRRSARTDRSGNASKASRLLLPVASGSRGVGTAWLAGARGGATRARKMSLRSLDSEAASS